MLEHVSAIVEVGTSFYEAHGSMVIEHTLVWTTAIFALVTQLRDKDMRKYIKPRRIKTPDVTQAINELESHRDTIDE